jgi:hypothetical protein
MNCTENCPTPCFNQFCWDFISTWWLWLFSLAIANSTIKALGSGTSGSAVCSLGLTFLNYVLILCMACPLLGSHLWPWWILVCVCVCFLGVFWRTQPMILWVLWVWGFPSYLYVIFIHVVCGYLASEYMAFCLYNKSLTVEHQFTICRLFDFSYCVCVYRALGPCFHNSQREMKYRNSGAGCSRSLKLCLYAGS